MTPDLPGGTFALFRRARAIRVGDIVLVRHRVYGQIVKRVTRIAPEGYQLAGTSPTSTSPEKLGIVPKRTILGTLLWTRR